MDSGRGFLDQAGRNVLFEAHGHGKNFSFGVGGEQGEGSYWATKHADEYAAF